MISDEAAILADGTIEHARAEITETGAAQDCGNRERGHRRDVHMGQTTSTCRSLCIRYAGCEATSCGVTILTDFGDRRDLYRCEHSGNLVVAQSR